MWKKSKSFISVLSFLAVTTSVAGESISPLNVVNYAISNYSGIALRAVSAKTSNLGGRSKKTDRVSPEYCELQAKKSAWYPAGSLDPYEECAFGNHSYAAEMQRSEKEQAEQDAWFSNGQNAINRGEREANLDPSSPEYWELQAKKSAWYPAGSLGSYEECAFGNHSYAAEMQRSEKEQAEQDAWFSNGQNAINRGEREANLDPSSPEYWELQAEKYDRYAEGRSDTFYKDGARKYRNQAAEIRQSKKEYAEWAAKTKADQALREQERLNRESQTREWARSLGKLKMFSPEWHRLTAETYRIQAEWYPDYASRYNQDYVDCLKQADEKEKFLRQKALAEENERNRKEAQKQAELNRVAQHPTQEALWKEEEKKYEPGSVAWYRFYARVHNKRASWYAVGDWLNSKYSQESGLFASKADAEEQRQREERR